MAGRHSRDYYGASAPPAALSRRRTCPRPGLAVRARGRHADGSHVHHVIDRSGRRPALPRQHRHGYAADLHRGLPTGELNGFGVDPHHTDRGRALHPGPYPPDLSRLRLRGFNHWFLSLHLLALLAGPAPSGSAGTSRRCRGCFHPPRRSPDQAAPSFTRPLRRPDGEGLSPPLDNPAPRGAQFGTVRTTVDLILV